MKAEPTHKLIQRRISILKGINRGEKAILEGRTISQEQARAKMHKWLNALDML